MFKNIVLSPEKLVARNEVVGYFMQISPGILVKGGGHKGEFWRLLDMRYVMMKFCPWVGWRGMFAWYI